MIQTKKPARPKFPAERFDALATPFKRFLHTEAAGGVVLLLAAVAALVIANSAFGPAFEAFWQTPIGLSVGDIQWTHSLRHWINDGLVTLFFFVVGLEIKREIVTGELSKKGAIALPLAAALGGMLVPAAIYLAIASEAPSEKRQSRSPGAPQQLYAPDGSPLRDSAGVQYSSPRYGASVYGPYAAPRITVIGSWRPDTRRMASSMNRLVPTPAVPSIRSVPESPAAEDRMTVASLANASSRPTKRALVYLAGIASHRTRR